MPGEHIPAALRRQVRARARELCEYCRCCPLHHCSFSLRTYPPSRGRWRGYIGESCVGVPLVNACKYTKTHAPDSQTGRLVPLFHPRRQRWSRHFTWSEDFIVVIGLTAQAGLPWKHCISIVLNSSTCAGCCVQLASIHPCRIGLGEPRRLRHAPSQAPGRVVQLP